MVPRGDGSGGWVPPGMGVKDGPCQDEHSGNSGTAESLHGSPRGW